MQQQLLQPAATLAAALIGRSNATFLENGPYVVSVFLECYDALVAAQKQILATELASAATPLGAPVSQL